jgi:hypothetical protein
MDGHPGRIILNPLNQRPTAECIPTVADGLSFSAALPFWAPVTVLIATCKGTAKLGCSSGIANARRILNFSLYGSSSLTEDMRGLRGGGAAAQKCLKLSA